jgi:leucyl-tRNA synthetase
LSSRSTGAKIRFPLFNNTSSNTEGTIEVYTTRPETIYGVRFLAVAADHPCLASLATELQGTTDSAVKFTGLEVVHPLTQARLPVIVADYVLSAHGTGAVMGELARWRIELEASFLLFLQT